MKIAVLVSGGGTNLQAIIDGIANGTITNTEICLVYSNNPNAYAIERAKKAGIPYAVKSPKEFENREEFNKALLATLKEADPDLIVLAGCLVVIPEIVVKAFPNRIINIHPSLIPSFCGTGFYGLKVHEKVLERGVRVSGATVHFVDEGTDTGPIILQKAVYVRQDDTPETLQRRIMEQAEWKIMPLAIDLLANDKIKVTDGKVYIDGYEESILG
jgi:phosphoribosylglycinamide formyltransferase-1